MFCGTKSIPQNIPPIQTECREYPGIFYGVLSVPQNIVMDLNNIHDFILLTLQITLLYHLYMKY